MRNEQGFSPVIIIVAFLVLSLLAIRIVSITDDNKEHSITGSVEETLNTDNGAIKSSDTLYYDSNISGNYEIFKSNKQFSAHEAITDNSSYDSWWPKISPDKSTLIFYRTPAGIHDKDYSKTELWSMDLTSNIARKLLDKDTYEWEIHGHAEWSPDGKNLVMFGGRKINPQIHITDFNGKNPEQITNDGGQNLDPSWHPNGEKIVYIACPNSVCFQSDQEVYETGKEGGDRTRLTDDSIRDNDPYYSPSGDKIAFLSQTSEATDSKIAGEWNTRIIKDSKVSQLTDYMNVLSLPAWVDDRTIYTHGLEYGNNRGFDLYSIDVESQKIKVIYSLPKDQEYISL